MPPEAAEQIYERRLTKPFKSVEDITRELPVNIGTTARPFLATDLTGTYTLTAWAHSGQSRARRVIRAVISLDRGEKLLHRTLYWNENVPVYEGTAP
jgi:hypothetical protein